MVLQGETVRTRKTQCSDCKSNLDIEVLKSNAGFYIGFLCYNCGPYSRESDYYKTRELAEKALEEGFYHRG